MSPVSRSQTTSIKRPPKQAAADEGRSRLGDFTRPIPVDKRISRRPKVALFAGLGVLAVIAVLGAAIFILPIGTWRDQDVDLTQRQAELDELSKVNGQLTAEVDRLQTDDGIREAAREEIGYVEQGERRSTILPLPPLPTDLPDGWPYSVVTGIIAARQAGPAPAETASTEPASTEPAPTETVAPAADEVAPGLRPTGEHRAPDPFRSDRRHRVVKGVFVAGSILGERVLRKEDPKFLTTGGVYVDDMVDDRLTGAAHVVYVRSSAAHGTILSIDTDEARTMPGVIAVFTAADLELQPTPSPFNPMVARTLLASDKVRYVGEPVVAVVAETPAQGVDAAESVFVDIDFLPAVVDIESAGASATLIYESAGSNVVFDTTVLGMPENTAADEYFADCEVTVSGRFLNQRVAPCPLEVRGAAAAWIDGRLHQWVSTQHAQGIKDTYVAVNGVDAADVRVLTPDVGGGFGAKIGSYPEELLLGPIAKRIGRPVKWRETRSESMMALGHGRAQLQNVTLGGSRDGKVTHYQLHAIQDCGGFVEVGAVLAPFMTRPMSSGVYAIPNIEVRTTSVVTNTTPIVAYRGAGRPEATAAIERGMDIFAAEIGMDPAEVRRINLIPKFLESYTTHDRPDLRRRRLRDRARQSPRRGRLHRAPCRAGQASGVG